MWTESRFSQTMHVKTSLLDGRDLLSEFDADTTVPSSATYGTDTSTWAAQKNFRPQKVIRPKSVDALSKALSYLNTTNIDFAVRGSGMGSSSAKDLLISTTAFDDFHFDKEAEIVTLGAGLLWRDYYARMAEVAPDYQGSFSMASHVLETSTLTSFRKLSLQEHHLSPSRDQL
jgi:FAD/FMN-containing dehydrogenase